MMRSIKGYRSNVSNYSNKLTLHKNKGNNNRISNDRLSKRLLTITTATIAALATLALALFPVANQVAQALSITSLSETKGPMAGQNEITIKGEGFLKQHNETIVNVASGYQHTIALTSDGRLYAWGLNSYGQLGLGDQSNRNIPTEIKTDFDGIITNVYAGYYSTSVLTSTGKIYS